MKDMYRQDGGQPNLGLAEVDLHLDYPNKSVENLSDPEFRLLVLWTCVGQYQASAQRDREALGDDFPTVSDARHHQLISRWTHEARRVYPDIRNRDANKHFSGGILGLIDEGKLLNAYLEILDLREECPEFIHPDLRFDLMASICNQAVDLPPEDSFRTLVHREMIDETIPGGTGYCDDAERLRRYHILSGLDESMAGIVERYIVGINKGTDGSLSDFFEFSGQPLTEILNLIVERRYTDLARDLVNSGVLDFDEEAMLIEIL